MNKKIKLLFFLLVLISVFTFIYILNYNTAYVTDDYIYQFVFENRYPTHTTRLISNPLDIFISMANHWKLWGGRVTIHFLLQFAFMLGKNFFNIFNTIMFILLGLLVYCHINKKKNNISLLITIYAVIFLFVPQPGSTIFWKSGSANYLWSSVFLLVMTLIFKKHFDDENNIKDNFMNQILLLLYGVFTGCTNENTGCALIISIILFIIFYKIKYNNIPKWSYFALFGAFISYIFLLISPGNYIRTQEMYPGLKLGITNLIDYTLRITRLTNMYIGTILIIAIDSFIIILKKKKTIKQFISEYGIQIIFFAFSLISIYSLVLSPAYPERCWMFAFIYLIIIIGLNISSLEESKYSTTISKVIVILMFTLSIKSISAYNEAYYDIVDTKACIDDHVVQIKEQLKQGKKDISVHSSPAATSKYNAFSYNGYLTYNKESWTNRWIAEYYGISSIVAQK